MQLKCPQPEKHDENFDQLHTPDDRTLAETLTQIASHSTEQNEWQRKDCERNPLFILTRKQSECGHQQQQLLEEVVIERTEQLSTDQRAEVAGPVTGCMLGSRRSSFVSILQAHASPSVWRLRATVTSTNPAPHDHKDHHHGRRASARRLRAAITS